MINITELARLTGDLESKVPQVKGAFPDFLALFNRMQSERRRKAIYVLGTIKAGKSTFINALLGHDTMPRGLGVKTYSLTRVRHDDAEGITIRFKSGDQLKQHLRFSFRLLGYDASIPDDLFAKDTLPLLHKIYQGFEQFYRDDGRAAHLEVGAESSGLIALALARVRRTLQGLEELQQRFPAVSEAVSCSGCYEFNVSDSEFQAWVDSINMAALIQDIDIKRAYPKGLAPEVEIIDCQGSDSLNPLDFAAVESILHKTDLILYVINSRLCLRKADIELLEHLRRVGASERLILVLNAEAYEPVDEAQLARLADSIKKELLEKLGLNPPLYQCNALFELYRQYEPKEGETIQSLWERRGFHAVLTGMNHSFAQLMEEIGGSLPGHAVEKERVLPVLINTARTTSKALLERDLAIVGMESARLHSEEIRAAVARVVGGEREVLEQRLAEAAFRVFDSVGPIETKVQAFLRSGEERLLKDLSLLEDLKNVKHHAPIVEAALECFNRSWLKLDHEISSEHILPLVELAREAIIDSTLKVHRVLPAIVPAAAFGSSELLADPGALRLRMERDLAQAFMTTTRPAVLLPVVLMPAIRNAVIAEFYSGRFFSEVIARLSRKQVSPHVTTKKVVKLWTRTVRLCFRQAREDAELGLSSSRENYKFQYFFVIAQRMLAEMKSLVYDVVERYYNDLADLEDKGMLLLNDTSRQHLDQYLAMLDG